MMKISRLHLFLFGTQILFSFNLLFATTPEKQFEEANSLFKSAKYSRAIVLYDSLVTKGYRSSELFFNLAYSHSKTGETGKSILYLERALRYDPSNERAERLLVNENLKIREKIARIPQFFIFKFFEDTSRYFSSWGWFILLFTSFIAGLVFLTGYLLKWSFASKKNSLFVLPVLLLLYLLLIPSFIISYDRETNLREVIVLNENIELFEVPEISGKKEGLISEGNKLMIVNDLSGWFRVKLSNGKEGWIIKKGVEEI
jgi:tetratricopeptide (TPR) repeat protein